MRQARREAPGLGQMAVFAWVATTRFGPEDSFAGKGRGESNTICSEDGLLRGTVIQFWSEVVLPIVR